jgi:hypothetical protein
MSSAEDQAEASGVDLSLIAKLERASVRMLWINDYYDGALSGAAEFDGRLCWFSYVDDDDLGRRYLLHELSERQRAEERRWHALFVEHVGDHWTSTALGSSGVVKPVETHSKFYDEYNKSVREDYSKNVILGWFEDT